MKLLKEQPAQIKAEYGDRFELEFPSTEMGMHIIEQVLIPTIFHKGMHLQTFLGRRKFMKKDKDFFLQLLIPP
ncbi:hypothetical protein V7111_20685 [Neobacillus niacini]|uniref:hypothetical protein n=1 Tax=Neobacillus niacini TaxID=86668 RepID=UPI003002175B